jgi:hypothetical protein
MRYRFGVSTFSSRGFDQSSGHERVFLVTLAAALAACSGEPAGASGAGSGGAAGLPAANGGTAGTPAVGAGGSLPGGASPGGGGTGGAVPGVTGGSGPASGGSLGNGGSVANGGSGGFTSGASGMAPAAGGAASGGAPGASGGGPGGGSSTFTDADALVPHASWDCGMPAGIPPTAGGELVLEATAQVGEVYDLGQTQYGHRYQTEIKGGTVAGPKIEGTLMDRGLDYELDLANGAIELEEINILKTSDGASIYLRTCGTAPGPGNVVRIVPDFEAPNASAYAFLNTAKLVGTRELDKAKKTLKFTLYSATAAAPARTVTVAEPDGVPNQTWECKKAAGTKGAVVYTESVGIGAGSVSVGASKRGTRKRSPESTPSSTPTPGSAPTPASAPAS